MALSTAQILERYRKARKTTSRPHDHLEDHVDRNCALYKDLKLSHYSIVELVSKYRISSARIYQIVNLIEGWASEGSRTRRKIGATPNASLSGGGRGKELAG